MLLAVGALIHLDELFPLAAAAVVLVLSALAWVHWRTWAVEGHRVVAPERVALGGVARVDLAVTNRGERPSPLVSARDPFDNGRRFARFAVAPLAPGATVTASYRLPTTRRGVFPLGPLEFRLHDPLGLATAYRVSGQRSRLCVHPVIEPLPSLGARWGTPAGAAEGAGRNSPHGTEFYALREYQVGDDLRRVHWTSSARRDQLMIRQDHDTTRPRTLLIGDMRPGLHSARSLERTLSAVASLADSALRGGHTVRVILVGTPVPADTGWGDGPAQRLAILDLLSGAVPPSAESPPPQRALPGSGHAAGGDRHGMRAVVDRLISRPGTGSPELPPGYLRTAGGRRRADGPAAGGADGLRRARFDAGSHDATVVVTTDAAPLNELAPSATAGGETAAPTVVVIEREGATATSMPSGIRAVRVPDGASFTAAWGHANSAAARQVAGAGR